MGVSFGIDIDKAFRKYNNKFKGETIFDIVKKKELFYRNNNKTYIDNLLQDKKILTDKLIKYRVNLFNIDFLNLIKYIEEKNYLNIELYTINLINNIYSLGFYMYINVNNDFDLIHKSNMSKLCVNSYEANLTVQNYIKLYKNNESPYDSPDFKLSKNKKYYIVYNKSTNKILKSINYNAVDLSS